MTTPYLEYPLQDGYVHNWLVAGPVETPIDVDAADAQVKVQFANDTTLTNSWIDYDTNSTITLSDTLGSHAFKGKSFLYKYMRVITIPNSVTSGEYTITLDKITNR